MIPNCDIYFGDDTVTITAKCIVTKKPYSVTVSKKDFTTYLHGTLAQDAFPTLSYEDREFLISGTSPEGWRKLHGYQD